MALTDLLKPKPAGAAPDDVAALEREVGQPLPPDLRAFLLASDGSEWQTFPDFAFNVLTVADMRGMFDLGPEDRSGPQHLLDVGSDGSRERFCLDTRTGDIVLLDIVGDEPPFRVAGTVTELVERLAAGWNPLKP